MTSRTSKLVFAAVLASSLPAAALARDCDHDHDRDRPPVYAPQPAYPTPPAPAPDRWQDGTWRDGSRRHGSWRERELMQVRAELRALDEQRAELHARFAWNPRKLRKLERWYAVRRAELERRWHELQYVAWR